MAFFFFFIVFPRKLLNLVDYKQEDFDNLENQPGEDDMLRKNFEKNNARKDFADENCEENCQEI
jgi:hypothetical protein